jgi:WD40 repeat protein
LVNRLALSPDGSLAASAQDDLTLRLWDAATGKAIRTIRGGHVERTTVGRASTLYSVAFSPDGRLVASGDRVGGVCVWEAGTGALVHKLSAASLYTQALYNNPLGPNISSEYEWGGVRALTFTKDGKQLLAGGMGPADQNSAGLDGLMLIVAFEVESGKGLTSVKLEKSKGVLYSLQPHPEGRWVFGVGGGGGAGSGGSGTVCAWDYAARDADGKPAPVLAFPSAMVMRDFAWNKEAGGLYAVGMEKGVLSGRIEEWML